MLPSWKTEKEKTVDMKGALVYAKEQYSPELKIQIAREYESSKCSISSLANHYGIDHGTIEQWIKQYEAKGGTTFM